MAGQLVDRTRHPMIYKIRNIKLCLPDIPADVFKKITDDINKDFFLNCNSTLFGTYARAQTELSHLTCKEALYLLGDKEQWTVETLVNRLVAVDNRRALQHLLLFWPAHFVKPPDSIVTVEPGDWLHVEVDAAGIPRPSILWADAEGCHRGEGPQLHTDQFRDGIYFVTAINEYKGQPAYEKRCFRVVTGHSSSSSRNPSVGEFDRYVDNRLPIPVERGCTNKGHGFTATQKVALLVGMTTYEAGEQAQLSGPFKDLPDLAKRFSSIGYEVLSLLDVPLDDLQDAIKIYGSLLSKGVYGVLYLSGHGIRFRDIDDDFLIPVGAPSDATPNAYLSRKKTLSYLQQMEPEFNLVIWDACRSQGERDVSDFVYEPAVVASETNLYHFCSTTAFKTAFEIQGHVANSTSMTVIKFLQLFDEGKREIGDMLVRLQTLICSETVQVGGQTAVMEPVVLAISNPNRSLWDPIVRNNSENGQYGQYGRSRVLGAWNNRQHPDARMTKIEIYPKPVLTADLPELGVTLRPRPYMHNVLGFSLSYHADFPAFFDIPRLKQYFRKDLGDENGQKLLNEWHCLRVKDTDDSSPGGRPSPQGTYASTIIFYHLQRYFRSSQSYCLRIPVIVKESENVWGSHCFYVRDLYIIQLFTALHDS